MQRTTLGPHEEGHCPTCGAPLLEGDSAYVETLDGPAWCSLECYETDPERLIEREESNA